MSQIEFKYKGLSIVILGEIRETMKDIINKFLTKCKCSKENLVFLYGEKK